MRGKLLALMAGTALLSTVSIASAGEPVILADSQLDQISAGVAFVQATLGGQGIAVVQGSFSLENAPGGALANISGTITPISGTSTLTLMAYAAVPFN